MERPTPAATGTPPGDRLAGLVGRTLETAARAVRFVEDEVAGLRRLVPRGGTCIDVGAEYGLYTVGMAAAVGPSGTVHAFEPQPDAHAVLARLTRLAGVADRVVRHRCALGESAGSGRLSVPLRRGRAVHGRAFLTAGASHGGPNDVEFEAARRIDVEVRTLDGVVDELGLRRLDVVKADVEGAELSVLRGGEATLDRFRPAVQLEIEQPHLDKYEVAVAEVTGFLLDRGYRMLVWGRRGWGPAARVTAARRNYLFAP